MPSYLIIIPCGSKKRLVRSRADELYLGLYHKKALAWARSVTTSDMIRILSGKHGLLNLGDEIDPYEMMMGDDGCVSMETVKAQADAQNLTNWPNVAAVGGVAYRLVICRIWSNCFFPFKDEGGIGYQQAAMGKALGILREPVKPVRPPTKRLDFKR